MKRGLSRSSSLSNLVNRFQGIEGKPQSWEVLEQLASQPGFKYDLSQFSVIKQIGSGAFGRVLLCTHDLTGQKVVLKAIDKRHIKKPKHLQVRGSSLLLLCVCLGVCEGAYVMHRQPHARKQLGPWHFFPHVPLHRVLVPAEFAQSSTALPFTRMCALTNLPLSPMSST